MGFTALFAIRTMYQMEPSASGVVEA